jgi:hypothetical protein
MSKENLIWKTWYIVYINSSEYEIKTWIIKITKETDKYIYVSTDLYLPDKKLNKDNIFWDFTYKKMIE